MQKLLLLRDIVTKYLLAAIFIAVPLYPKFPLIKVPNTFVSIRLEDMLIAFSGLILIGYYLPNIKYFFKNKLNLEILIFLLTGAISLFSAILITSSVIPNVGFLHWVRRIEYFIPLFLAYELIKKGKVNIDFYVKVLLIVMFLVFIYGFGQKNFTWPIIITQNEEYSKGVALRWIDGSHINSTFAGHYDLATFLVMTMPILINSFFIIKGRYSKLFLFLAYFSGMWLLVNTASRISLFSYIVSSTLGLILIKRYKAIPIILVLSILFIAFSSNLLDRYARLFEVTRDKIYKINLIDNNTNIVFAANEIDLEKNKPAPTPTPTPVFEDRSTNIRLNVEWPRALRAFSKNPLLGTGYSSVTLATDNDYLRLLGEVGILGFITFFLILLRILIRFLSIFPLNKNLSDINLAYISGFLACIPGVLINAFFIDIFEASKFALIFWMFMGISLGIISNKKKYE